VNRASTPRSIWISNTTCGCSCERFHIYTYAVAGHVETILLLLPCTECIPRVPRVSAAVTRRTFDLSQVYFFSERHTCVYFPNACTWGPTLKPFYYCFYLLTCRRENVRLVINSTLTSRAPIEKRFRFKRLGFIIHLCNSLVSDNTAVAAFALSTTINPV